VPDGYAPTLGPNIALVPPGSRRAGSRADPEGGHWVKFVVTRVPASREKPHGVDYSLTLHGPGGKRLVGFDNAHPVAPQEQGEAQDHHHRLRTVRPYEYSDAATLLADFGGDARAEASRSAARRVQVIEASGCPVSGSCRGGSEYGAQWSRQR
jgi:hypothetical protein